MANFSEHGIRNITVNGVTYKIKGNNFCATATEWETLYSDYIPGEGDLIIFTEGDSVRLKIGDGTTTVMQLRFLDDILFSDDFILDCGTSTVNI